MQAAGDAPVLIYSQAYIGLGLLLAYYVAMSFLLRRKARTVMTTRYEPPRGISPAVAANLWGNGRCERAFAATLVSLAVKGYLRIRQDGERFFLERRRPADATLPLEESKILEFLFPGAIARYGFGGAEYGALCDAYHEFEEVIADLTEPELLSPHLPYWLVGVGFSIVVLIPVVGSLPLVANGEFKVSLLYIGIWILLGGSAFVAALRVWPFTIHKLTSFWPWDERPSRPLDANDVIPFVLTGAAMAGFVFLASLTSTQFALLVTAIVFLNAVFRYRLEAPTRVGRKLLAELEGFREFLARADAGRLNQENQPGQTPETLEKYAAYAVALEVEHAWGEEFVDNLVELLQMDRAYRRRAIRAPVLTDEPVELKLTDRK